MTAAALLLGAGVGLGLYLAWSALIHAAPGNRGRRTRAQVRSWQPRVVTAAAGALALGTITRWPVLAAAGAGLGWFARDLLGGRAAREAAVARSDAIATWAEMLRDTLSGAHGLEEVIVTTAPIAPVPIRDQVVALADRLAHERLAPALRRLADDLADPTADLVVATLVLAAETSGRDLSEVLGALAMAARDEAAMHRRVDAARARARATVQIVTGLTLVMMVALLLFSRSYLAPYNDALGQAVLALIAGLFGLGLWWLGRMGHLVAPERFLNPDAARPR
jgi:Flp pilus assembly protein TadB